MKVAGMSPHIPWFGDSPGTHHLFVKAHELNGYTRRFVFGREWLGTMGITTQQQRHLPFLNECPPALQP